MWKWFKWVLLGLGILIIGFAIFWFVGYKEGNNFDFKNIGKPEANISLAEDLPACPADTSSIFTKPFMDNGKPDFIVPLGNSNESGHVVPVDHVYPTNQSYEKDVPVYAPGDITLIWVENKQMHNSNTNEITRADYQLNFAPCRGLNLAFIHIDKLSPKLEEAIGDENSNCDASQKMDYGLQEGIPTYYVTCHPDFKKIRVSAGEIIGYFSGQTDKNFTGFDIGMYDYLKPALAFINPERYYDDTLHTACFADYYIPELKAKYEAKFGSFDSGNNGQTSLIRRTASPVCGQVMWDVAGTLAGDWFKNPVQKNITDNDALVLIHDNIHPELAKLSMANVTSFTFAPTHSSTINREFSEVTDNKIYCYQAADNISNTYIDKDGKIVTKEGVKYLLQLIDATHVKAESQTSVCSISEAFSNPTTYER